MVTGYKLSKINDSPDVNQSDYRSMIGILIYITTSRLNLMQAICMVSHFQYAPKQFHLIAMKRIFKYIQGTLDFGLWYPWNDIFSLMAFVDVDWAGCLDDWKSTSGAAFYLGDCLVAWQRKKQESILLSTSKVECIVATSCCT